MVLSNPFRRFFPQTQMISSHLCANQYLAQFLEILYRSLELSLCENLFIGFLLYTFQLLWSFQALSLFNPGSQLTSPAGFPLLGLQPGNSLKAVYWHKCRSLLICFLSLKDHCSSLPAVQCHENHCFVIFCLLFGGFRQKGKSGFSYFKYSYYYWEIIIC